MKQRQKNIVQRLLATDYPIARKMLANQFDLSERTIRQEIALINDWLRQAQLPEIFYQRNGGYYLKMTPSEVHDFETLCLLDDPIDRYRDAEYRELDILLTALSDRDVYIYEKEEQFQVSKSTIDNDMRQIRERLKPYQLRIISDPQTGLKLVGSERMIRLVLYEWLSHYTSHLSLNQIDQSEVAQIPLLMDYFGEMTVTTVQRLFNHYFSQEQDDVYKDQAILNTLIWVDRSTEHPISIESDLQSLTTIDPRIEQFIQDVITICDLNVSATEKISIQFMLQTLLKVHLEDEVSWLDVQYLTIALIDHIERQLDLSLNSSKENLYERLFEHNLGLLSRVKNHLQVSNPLTETIRQDHQSLFNAIDAFLSGAPLFRNFSVKEDEIAFLTIHFLTAVRMTNQAPMARYKAVVFCNYGLATGYLLAENLKQYFPIDVIDVLPMAAVSTLAKRRVDVVFATTPIPRVAFPTLIIEPIFTVESQRLISQFLNDHPLTETSLVTDQGTEFFKKVLKLIETTYEKVTIQTVDQLYEIFTDYGIALKKESYQPMINQILTDEFIQIHLHATDWEESIELAAQPLVDAERITPGYVEAMKRSVHTNGPYIVIGPHLALAHARPEDGVQELSLSVATFDPGVVYGANGLDPVGIVFCLAAVDSYSHLNIMKELIELINDPNRMKDIIKAKDKVTFKNILFQTVEN